MGRGRESTFDLGRDTARDRAQTLAELGLCGAQLGEGGREVLELVVELFFYLA
jgi:hypothetical protein